VPQQREPAGPRVPDVPTSDSARLVAGHRSVCRYDDLAAVVRGRPARLGLVRLVAIDGGTGSGKTVFAGRLAGALARTGTRVEVVHTDDLLDGWADQFTFWPRLEETVLRPLGRGEPARQPRYDWAAGRFGQPRVLPVPQVLILDGVGTARTAAAALVSFAVLVVAGRAAALRRALRRDGRPEVEPVLRRWQEAEAGWYRGDGTATRVDTVVDGDPAVRHDPEQEFVTIGEVDAWTRPRTADRGSL